MFSLLIDLMTHPKECIQSGKIKHYHMLRFSLVFLLVLWMLFALLSNVQSPDLSLIEVFVNAYGFVFFQGIEMMALLFLCYAVFRFINPINKESRQVIFSEFFRESFPLFALLKWFNVLILIMIELVSASSVTEFLLRLSIQIWFVYMLCLLAAFFYRFPVRRCVYLIFAYIIIQPVSNIIMIIALQLID